MINEQLVCKKLDLALNSTELFQYFVNSQDAIFLDSANLDHPNGRFDIIAFEPKDKIEVHDNQTYLNHTVIDACPFDTLKSELAKLCDSPAPHNLPFSGGALGFFSYDLGRIIEKMPNEAIKDISLAQMRVGIYYDALIYDHHNQTWFYIAQPKHDRLAQILMRAQNQNTIDEFHLSSNWCSNMSQSEYENRFDKIQSYLLSGDCYQINLAQRFKAHYQGHPYHAYLKLRAKNKAPFSAYINAGRHQIASLSPERFIQVQQGHVETKPIKGTLPRHPEPEQDQRNATTLAHSTKDRAENVMIVDLLRNDLGKVAKPGSVKVPKLFDIESFSAVHHLVSTVTSELDPQYSAVDQLKAAFPGGSITGAPKIRAMEIIDELEPHRRSIYCGSIGFISACGKMDTSITIRTLVTEENRIYCWAGGGIVADSKAHLEYQETYDKVNKILPEL